LVESKFSSWWINWRNLLLRVFTLIASYFTIVGVALPFLPQPKDMSSLMIILLVLSFIALLVVVVLEIRTRRGRQIYMKSDKDAIRKYLHEWIEHGGRVAIWTRDMSWADNTATQQLLRDKAQARELIICLPQKTSFTRELESQGAEICAYDGSEYDPSSRFTITEFKRVGSRVAVGRTEGEFHIIDEFDSADHPAFYLAEDLVAVVRAKTQERR
jgi:hypothetical protein